MRAGSGAVRPAAGGVFAGLQVCIDDGADEITRMFGVGGGFGGRLIHAFLGAMARIGFHSTAARTAARVHEF